MRNGLNERWAAVSPHHVPPLEENIITSLHSYIHIVTDILADDLRGWSPSQLTKGQEARFTLDRLPVQHRTTYRHSQPPTGNLESPVSLIACLRTVRGNQRKDTEKPCKRTQESNLGPHHHTANFTIRHQPTND